MIILNESEHIDVIIQKGHMIKYNSGLSTLLVTPSIKTIISTKFVTFYQIDIELKKYNWFQLLIISYQAIERRVCNKGDS